MLLRGVLEQLGQLKRVLADLLHGREEEAIQGDVNHLLEQAARLEEVPVPALLHQARQLGTGARVVVTVLGVDGEALLLARVKHSFIRLWVKTRTGNSPALGKGSFLGRMEMLHGAPGQSVMFFMPGQEAQVFSEGRDSPGGCYFTQVEGGAALGLRAPVPFQAAFQTPKGHVNHRCRGLPMEAMSSAVTILPRLPTPQI